MGFSDEIKAIRQECFLSQEAFAKELGVSFATVNRWETGRTRPTYKTMKLIDDFCRSRHIDFSILKELKKEEEALTLDQLADVAGGRGLQAQHGMLLKENDT